MFSQDKENPIMLRSATPLAQPWGGALYLESRHEPLCAPWHNWARKNKTRICRCMSFETASHLIHREKPTIVICRGVLSVESQSSGAHYLKALQTTAASLRTQLVIISPGSAAASNDALSQAAREVAPSVLTVAVADGTRGDETSSLAFATRCLEEALATGDVVEAVRDAQCTSAGVDFCGLGSQHVLPAEPASCLLLPLHFLQRLRAKLRNAQLGGNPDLPPLPSSEDCRHTLLLKRGNEKTQV